MIKKQPWHKGFKRKTPEQAVAARRKFADGKSELRLQKDKWNDEWKRDHAHVKFCWSCGVHPDGNPENTITQMHALKQRFCTTREACRRSAWVCWREHRAKDEAQGKDVHAKMAEFVDGLIRKMSRIIGLKK
jgi:hypothetical protein